MSLVLVGLSHKTAPIEIRERIAFAEDRLSAALMRLKQEFGLQEGMIISTCNRVEIIAQGTDSQLQAVDSVKNFLYSYHALRPPFLEDYLYAYQRHDAIRHVFRVASSLDSMVVGEPQILSQMKRSYLLAQQAGSIGNDLKSLIPRAFFVAKRVRSVTRIGTSAVSISSVAVELARKIFGDLSEKSVLLLGSGKMGALAARSLADSGVRQISVAGRSPESSQQLASQFHGRSVSFDALQTHLVQSDIVLVSTSASSFLLDSRLVEAVIRERRYRPLFVIDISVPRNVDPQVNNIDNVFLYDIDDLQSVMDANLLERHEEAELAEEIVAREVDNFRTRMNTQDIGPLLGELRERIEEICLTELKVHQNTLTSDEYDRMEKIVRKTAHKIAHPLITEVKSRDESPVRRYQTIKMILSMFQRDPQK